MPKILRYLLFINQIFFLMVFLLQKIYAQDTLKNISFKHTNSKINSQQIDTNTTQIINAQSMHSYFGRKIKVYKDPTQKLSFEEIRKKEFLPNFIKTSSTLLNTDTTYWFKWDIFTDLVYDTYKLLSVGWNSEVQVFLEYPQENIITLQQTGINLPVSKRDIKILLSKVKCFLPKKQRIIIWVKAKNYHYAKQIHFKFFEQKEITDAREKDISHYLVLQGILFMFLLYNVLLLILSKDITYFYYLVYILVSQSILGVSAIPEYFFIGEYLYYQEYIFLFLLCNIGLWYILFVKHFNQMHKHLPVFDSWTVYYVSIRFLWLVFIFASNIFSYAGVYWCVNLSVLLDIIWGIIMIIMGYSKIEKNNIAQQYIPYGSICLFIGGGGSALLPSFGFKMDFILLGFTISYFEIGLFAQLAIFSIGLSIRGQNIEKEKQIAQTQLIQELEKNEKLIKEQNQILEEKVALRTQELNNMLQLVEQERKKSDALLLNILPDETAQELKNTGTFIPKSYKLVTVLFTDFRGFTHISEQLTPVELIENLNTCFLAFDEICEKYHLEKIKTIGDAYMCAGGLPIANQTNPIDVVKAGLEMQKFMADWKMKKEAKGELAWELRLGIHTGEVIAGVVGKNKFVYDIWGDTVNLASRMESSGEVGKVNISETTYHLIKNQFQCVYRGEVKAKNKGDIKMYFVDGELV